ncbi:unnamed protein product [Cuscuta campestris]|uniref:HMG box domain-containing protein n=1 Tax=Cuscuta campestris TaxID=132261 RepID=A0A484KR39_9ASTE|nr:unnamed protein product [Cuscuta campestris]
MAGGRASGKSSTAPRVRKRVEVDSGESSSANPSLKRAKDGSAFTRCDECNKDVPVALISFHNCSLDAKIKMNLEAQIIEMPAEVKKKPSEKKKTSSTQPKAKKPKDPNAPKRPPTAFFVFMQEFRKTFNEANPDNKKASMVAKEGGEKWNSLTDEEKKPYIDRAAELKAEYEKALEANNAAANEDDGDESDKEAKETEAEEEEEEE